MPAGEISALQRTSVVEAGWRRTLASILTLLGKLAHLASLRTGDAGKYQHFGIAQRLGEQATHEMLSHSHTEIFREWLSLDLAEQREDTRQYLFETGNALSETPPEGVGALASWIALESWAVWVPADSRDVERDLFRSDMKIVLELLRREAGVALRDPDL